MRPLKNSCALVTWRGTAPPASDVRTVEKRSQHTVSSKSVHDDHVLVGTAPETAWRHHMMGRDSVPTTLEVIKLRERAPKTGNSGSGRFPQSIRRRPTFAPALDGELGARIRAL